MDSMCFISHSVNDAPIAQLLCHRLEENGVRCWIAPRDINHTDWAGSIMDGLSKSNIFIILISDDSNQSPEVLKEVTEATRCCEYILPFKLKATDLAPRLRYHLGPAHWLDASTPPLEAHIKKLINRIQNLSDEDKLYVNQYRQVLKERIAWPKATFVGRERELESIQKHLQSRNVLFVQGMGGIGKSELVKAYAKYYPDQYDTIVFLNYEKSILDCVIGHQIQIENFADRNASLESEAEYFIRKMAALRKITSERTLLILDNYDVTEDPHIMELTNGKYHLLITTRVSQDEYPQLNLQQIQDFDTLRGLFLHYWKKEPTPEEEPIIDEILQVIHCHTITVELIAKQMRASRRKPKDMLTLLKKNGVNTRLRETIKQDGSSRAESAFSFIRQLFQLSLMSEEEIKLLQYMTIAPISGIPIEIFYKICQLEDYNTLNELISRSWLMLEEESDILKLHPIIADVVREEYAVTAAGCADYLRGAWNAVGNLWFKSQEERAVLWPIYAGILAAFPEPIPALWDEYLKFSSNAWICGRYSLAIDIGTRTLALVQREFPQNPDIIGQAARNLGGCYHNAGDDAHAEIYYNMGLEAQMKYVRDDSSAPTIVEYAISYQKVGRCARIRGDFKKSKKCLEESLRLSMLVSPDRPEAGDTIVELARLHFEMHEYTASLEYSKQALSLFRRLFGKEVPNDAYAYTDMGKCYTVLEQFEQAEQALEEALRINLHYHGVNSIQTILVKEAMADLFLKEGKREQAIEIYQALLWDAERDFGEHAPNVEKLRMRIREI